MNLYSLHDKPEDLSGHDKQELVPYLIWKKFYTGRNKKKLLMNHEKTLAKDAQYAYKYAYHILAGPFKEGEPTLSKNAKYSYLYSTYILKKFWPAGEAAISKNAEYSDLYLSDFPERKDVLAKLRK